MKLTDNEKREIFRHLAADKPLPDKYRFLLFGDKREVDVLALTRWKFQRR
ncbi:MAG: hypothetical protein K9K75_04985 [Deltaproteobacteria bacterium]|nr:hypothetical protein [Deltaproteobacteria bacterium]